MIFPLLMTVPPLCRDTPTAPAMVPLAVLVSASPVAYRSIPGALPLVTRPALTMLPAPPLSSLMPPPTAEMRPVAALLT